MKVSFTCKTEADADKVYDLLTNPSSGCECLSGSKECTNYYADLPDVWEFDLTPEEMERVLSLPEVTYGGPVGLAKIAPMYTKVGQTGIPKLASFTTTFDNNNTITSCIPHSMLYCQDIDTFFTQDPKTNGDVVASLSSIDCSNVDIIVVDSGVDGTHDDFKDSLGNSRVVNFNWTLLKDPTNVVSGPQIIASLPANWTSDFNGHGTACASLAAGNRCGFAKRAKIYFLKVNGLDPNNGGLTTIESALKLALSFHKSKKLNLHGLDSTRPTICTNSWGFQGPNTLFAVDNSTDNTNFSSTFQLGKRNFGEVYTEVLNYFDSPSDSYFRQMLDEGMHVLRAAGNNAAYIKNDPATLMNAHFFTRNSVWYVIPRTPSNKNSYTLGQTYNTFTYGINSVGFGNIPISYGSPSIGLNTSLPVTYSKEQYPFIIVGDITPVGFNDEDANINWTAGNAKAAFTVLSANTIPGYIKQTASTRYPTLSGPFFIKTSYSNFGPDVDIYTPGNGAWAALTNQANFVVSSPNFQVTPTGKYFFFNGTSSACPIAAGVLGTYLAEYPTKTNKEARFWLLQNAVSGNIMETEKNTLPVNSEVWGLLDLPFGSNYNLMNNRGYLRLVQANNGLFRQANIYDVALNHRFFDSANLVAQAFPLRRAVLKSSISTLNYAGTQLINLGGTPNKPSHSIESLPVTQTVAYELVEVGFDTSTLNEGVRLV